MTRLRLLLASLGLLAGAAHADANLLVNGSFETGDFSGWQTRLGDATTFVDFGPPGRAAGDATDGRFLGFFGSTQSSGGSFISQSFATLPGTRYVVSFDLADDNGGGAALNAFSVSIDGLPSPLFSAVALAPQDDVHHSLTFVARDRSSTLSLGGYNDLGYVQLDAVAVTVAAVPEPASWLLLAGGTGLLALRRRRAR